jgi:hypothetical protein
LTPQDRVPYAAPDSQAGDDNQLPVVQTYEREKEMDERHGLRRRLGVIAAAALLVLAVGVGVALADDNPKPVGFTHNAFDAPAPVAGAVFGTGPAVKTGTAICTTATSLDANVNTDCAPTAAPHNETSIAVNPIDSTNMIGGANDYQLGLNPGNHVSETVLSRAHVTFDGGQTWSEFPLYSNSAYQGTGDPAVAFDASGHAYYATLGFRFVGPFNATNPDVLVANSGDKGKTWSVSRVASGSGTATSVGDLLDKEYIAAWGDGNAIVTFGDFQLAQKGSFVSAKIYSSVTHNAGKTWSQPQVISGSLDEAFVSTPTVAADGRIFVSFLNTDDLASGRDNYKVVQVDPSTGAAIGGPVDVGLVYDGLFDYPWAFGRQTYQDSAFRTWAAGNITADPKNAKHLAVVWSDMRNTAGIPFTPFADPYSVTTNSDVIVSESTDGGQTWSATPTAITLDGDQFMPWGAFDVNGVLRIGTFDRSYDAVNHKYGYSLLTQTTPTTFAQQQVTDTLSDPTTGDRWFAGTLNANFPFATSFLGDYSNIAATSDGGVVAYWTDMRNDATFGSRTGHGEDAYFAKVGGP